ARWMTSPDNPLVARVIVNRLWQGHFGEGLVATENDFGVMGSPPSNSGLLDWLANELRTPPLSPPPCKGGEGGVGEGQIGAEEIDGVARTLASSATSGSLNSATPPGPPFQRGGEHWSLKRIHRLIVLSNTYGQSSDWREAAATADVENTL